MGANAKLESIRRHYWGIFTAPADWLNECLLRFWKVMQCLPENPNSRCPVFQLQAARQFGKRLFY
jgi:hypothetical protein